MIGRRALLRLTFQLGLLALVLALRVDLVPYWPVGSGQAGQGAEASVVLAQGQAHPAEATPGDPPAVPTLPAERVWRLSLRGFPDTVGKASYACPGCDGVFGSGDEMGSVGQPLEPLLAVVTEPGNPENVYWMGYLDRQQAAQAEVYTEAAILQPPPYEVRLITVGPTGYVLCPNSPPGFFVEQADFDAIAGGSAGGGRLYARDWFFWRCHAPR